MRRTGFRRRCRTFCPPLKTSPASSRPPNSRFKRLMASPTQPFMETLAAMLRKTYPR